ncbi:Rrf2 family transcriptional regulator [Paenarthrobacter sp. Z7-10]|uniref:RrF2 family transcriptional regulator n=1 Tax=Paenarthrobacter sp. Z7-10 TaxID=2787635 RepID=UPI0022A91C54|nr:Rrf2 family transcriptional regulator [Paenarthrobacter sp. Z7-10]MCZ2402954.1 Rrf2 family transcriptional regulator [Paenarthrobacter sp. Z7-10]
MHVTAKADYAIRAVVELALHEGQVLTRSRLATGQGIPDKFLETILTELTRNGLLIARRGVRGGYLLGRPADSISVADVLRAVDGPLAGVRGERPEDITYPDSSSALREVWIAVRASLRAVLETTTVADIAAQTLPAGVLSLLAEPGVWERR